MYKFYNILLSIFSIVLIFGCSDKDEYLLDTPKLEFLSIDFNKVPMEVNPNIINDEISLTYNFFDGGNNFGLTENDVDSPFHQINFYNLVDNSVFLTASFNSENAIRIGESDTLPPYDILNYYVFYDDSLGFIVNDTVLIQQNPNFYNIFCDIYYSKDGNSYEKYEFEAAPYYQNLNMRIKNVFESSLRNSYDYGIFQITPLSSSSAKVEIKLISLAFSALFQDQYLKVHLQIQDRAFNRSEIVESDPIFIE